MQQAIETYNNKRERERHLGTTRRFCDQQRDWVGEREALFPGAVTVSYRLYPSPLHGYSILQL